VRKEKHNHDDKVKKKNAHLCQLLYCDIHFLEKVHFLSCSFELNTYIDSKPNTSSIPEDCQCLLVKVRFVSHWV
jgi:hypothetical protein